MTRVTCERKKELHFHTLLLAICVAAAFFIPYSIVGNGYFLLYGDFNVQQVPFYQICHDAIRSGSIGWNRFTDLGVNFIGSYSFYLLGSPFFWLTIPFPSSFVPYLMGPLLILKFGFAAFTAYFYIRRFVRNPESAMLGGILYAFSGFSVYNIFFNHFHEAIILFPLLLLSMEMHICDNRRGVFALMVFLCAFVNYFFFFGMVVFCIIYWLIRIISGSIKQSLKSFWSLLLEAVIGLLLAAVILMPTILSVLQNNRLSEINYGYDSWLYGRPQIYANILEILFFPPDIPARPVFFPGADVKWSSLGAWLPLFSMVGVVAWFKSKKGHWINRVLGTCLFMALVPLLNSAFYMFNSAYYARWFYMPILLMVLCSVMAVEDSEVSFKSSYRLVLIITVAVTAIVGLWPDKIEVDGEDVVHMGLYTFEKDSFTYVARFAVACLIALLSLTVLYILLKKYRKYHKQFLLVSTAAACIVSVVYAAVFIGCGQSHSYDVKGEIIPNLIEGEINLAGDRDQYRIDTYDCMDNSPMFLGLSSINAFHSIVPGSVVDFYEYIDEERSVASRPSTACYAIRSLLSVKYLLNREYGDHFVDDSGEVLMPGFKYLKMDDGFLVYENENYIPYGFTYDYYVTESSMEDLSGPMRANMMVKALLLDTEQIGKYHNILKDVDTTDFSLGELQLAEDSAKHRKNCADYIEWDNKGFNSEIYLKKDNLVFYSIPYESGWKAYVNGKEVEVERVNKGFMAILCKKGSNDIRFEYTTPGLYAGAAVSGGALIIYIIYLLLIWKYRKGHPVKYNGEWPEGEELVKYWKAHPELTMPQPKEEIKEAVPDDEKPMDDTASEAEIDFDSFKKFINQSENDTEDI